MTYFRALVIHDFLKFSIVSFSLFSDSHQSNHTKRYDITGTMLTIVVNFFQYYQFLALFAAIYFKMDPFYLARKQINSLSGSNHCAWLALRLTQIFPCIQASRGYCCVIVVATIWMHLLLQCIETVGTTCENILLQNMNQVDKYFVEYNSLRIVVAMARVVIGLGTSGLMLLGIIFCVIMNYQSIKLHGILPTVLYICCVLLSVLIPALIRLLLPMMVDVNENGKVILEKWKYLVGRSVNKKYLVRKLKAIRLICIEGVLLDFRMYRCEKSVKAMYYSGIVNYTITALLAIDKKWFVS